MKNYAIIENKIVVNIILWDGQTGWTPPDGSSVVEIPESGRVQVGDGYEAGSFIPAERSPAVYVETPEQIAMRNAATKAQLLTAAGLSIEPLQDAVDLEMATADDKRLLLLWKQYRVAVNRLDITVNQPAWPALPA